MPDQWNSPSGQRYDYPQERPGYGPPAPPKKKHTVRNVFLGGFGVLVLIIVIAAVAGGGKGSGGASGTVAPAVTGAGASAPAKAPGVATGYGQHIEDVTIKSCTAGDFGLLNADLAVANRSSKASTYFITISFESADHATRYGEGDAVVNALAPGQVSNEKAIGSGTPPAGATMVCRVTSAQRTAA